MITKQLDIARQQRGAISAAQAGVIVVLLLVIAGGVVLLTGIWPPKGEPAPTATAPPPEPPPSPIMTAIEEPAPEPSEPPPPPPEPVESVGSRDTAERLRRRSRKRRRRRLSRRRRLLRGRPRRSLARCPELPLHATRVLPCSTTSSAAAALRRRPRLRALDARSPLRRTTRPPRRTRRSWRMLALRASCRVLTQRSSRRMHLSQRR